MNSKTILMQNNQKSLRSLSKSRKRRGVSEVIVTLILLAVTVIGAVMVFSVFQDTGLTEEISGLAGTQNQQSNKPSLKIIGYDTRDGDKLGNIDDLNNDGDGDLDYGSDMIVLQVRNTGTDEFSIERMSINEIVHRLDTSNSGQDISSTNEPSEGTFKIIPSTSEVILDHSELQIGQEVRLVIKLSDDFGSDIELNEELRIVVFPTNGKEIFAIVPAGGLQ